jgi:chorismate synthase
MQAQPTIDEVGNETILEGKGRHDACVVPRAVPIVEAMAAIVLLDFYLRNKSVHL